jgi:hypothetical protein
VNVPARYGEEPSEEMAADQVGGGTVDVRGMVEPTGAGLCLLLAAGIMTRRAYSDKAHGSSSFPTPITTSLNVLLRTWRQVSSRLRR